MAVPGCYSGAEHFGSRLAPVQVYGIHKRSVQVLGISGLSSNRTSFRGNEGRKSSASWGEKHRF